MDNDDQRRTAELWRAEFVATSGGDIVGISRNVREGALPINGLRHPPAGEASGWYIWAGGEPSASDDFFVPLHAAHLDEWCPEVLRYLGLAPGWRFQIAPGHEDVWFDPSLLHD
jgi:hypothetical protein